MEPTPQNCLELRELYFTEQSGSQPFRSHVKDCEACQGWLQKTQGLVGVLGSLDRLVAPLKLQDRVAGNLRLDQGLVAKAVRELPQMSAPAELDQRLATLLGHQAADEEPTQSVGARLVRKLESYSAPLVLERLVAEEIADLPAASVRRFAGDLFHQPAPKLLSKQVARAMQAVSKSTPRHRRRQAGWTAAAALLLLASIPKFLSDEPQTQNRFRVVEVTSLASLDPFARSLVEGLAGGTLVRMDLRKPSGTGLSVKEGAGEL